MVQAYVVSLRRSSALKRGSEASRIRPGLIEAGHGIDLDDDDLTYAETHRESGDK